MSISIRSLLAAIVSLAIIVSGFTRVNASETDALKIGAIFSITGKASALGIPEKNTVLMLMEEVNRTGGVNGFPLQIIVEDDMTLASGAKAAAEKLIDKDNVLAIIGPSITANSLEVKPICESARIPLVSCAAAEAIVTPAENSLFTFKTAQLDSHVVMRILEQISSMGINTVGVIAEKSPYGAQGSEKLKEYAPGFGLQVVADKAFHVNDIGMTRQLDEAKTAGAGAIVVWGLVPNQTIVAKNIQAMGWKVPLFYSHSFGNPKSIRDAGAAVEGVIFPSGRLLVADELPERHFHKAILKAYKNDYETRSGPVSTFGGHASDAFWIVVNSMKTKNISPSKEVAAARQMIRDGIEQTKGWLGVNGEFNMSAKDHTGLDKDKSLEMCVVRSGRVVPLGAAKR